MRSGAEDGALHGAEALLAAARREDSMLALDLAARDAALRDRRPSAGSTRRSRCSSTPTRRRSTTARPSCPPTRFTLLVEVTEQALIARPEAMLRALTRLRSAGWGIALDDVGGDSRSLALMSVLYPDVIKLDLRAARRALAPRTSRGSSPRSAPRPSAATRPCWRRGSTPRSSSRPRARSARRSARATCSARPAPLPEPLPRAGPRRCGCPAAAATRSAPTPWERVTNWRRPRTRLAPARRSRAARLIVDQRRRARRDRDGARRALRRGARRRARSRATAGCRSASRSSACSTPARRSTARGVRGGALAPDDPLRGTGTLVALAPDFAACFVVARSRRRTSGSSRSPTTATPWSSARCR